MPVQTVQTCPPVSATQRLPRIACLAAARAAGLALALACTVPEVSLPPIVHPDGPLDLHGVIALALANNPDVQAADAHLAAALADIDLAESAWWPALNVGAGVTRTDIPSRAFANILDQGEFTPAIDFNDPGPVTNVQVGAGAGLTLYDGGRRRAAARAAGAQAQGARALARQAREDVALAAARAYYLAHKAGLAEDTAQRAVGTLETQLGMTRARRAQGAARPTDEHRAAVALAEAREAQQSAGNASRRVLAGLQTLAGLGVAEPLELRFDARDAIGPAPAPVPGLGTLLQHAHEHRSELARADAAVTAAAAKLDAAAAGALPQLDLSAALVADDPNALIGASHWLAGLGLVENVMEAVRTPARVRRAAEQARATLAGSRRIALEVERDVQDARLDALDADQRQSLAQQSLALADDDLLRVTAERRDGVATAARLADAELETHRARARLDAARDDQALSRLSLLHATGELLDTLGLAGAGPEPGDTP